MSCVSVVVTGHGQIISASHLRVNPWHG